MRYISFSVNNPTHLCFALKVVSSPVDSQDAEIARMRTNSLNDSEEGSPEPGSSSPTHTPPLTPALTPQRESTPAPENLSLRKSGSPPQTQQTPQAVDLVQPRPSPPLASLAVSLIHFLNLIMSKIIRIIYFNVIDSFIYIFILLTF